MFLCHFYIRNLINFMSLIIYSHNLYINLMFLCHFILEI